MSPSTDWDAWHGPYDDPESPLSRRLRIIQAHIEDWLDRTDPAPVRVLSLCAGDGRDVLDVLARRADHRRVTATLLETDSRNVERARAGVASAGLESASVRQRDAGHSDSYVDAAPADLVLLCGIFGNIDEEAIERVVRTTPQLCNPGAHVIWTRHTKSPDLTPRIRGWFEDAGFGEVAFTAPADVNFSVGLEEYVGEPVPLARHLSLFEFTR